MNSIRKNIWVNFWSNKTKTLVSAREVMAERVLKRKEAMIQKESLKINDRN